MVYESDLNNNISSLWLYMWNQEANGGAKVEAQTPLLTLLSDNMKGESCACVYSKTEKNQCISHQSCSQLSSEGPECSAEEVLQSLPESNEIGLAKQG